MTDRTKTFGPTIETACYSLYRIGHWCALDARRETRGPDEYGLLTHFVTFRMLGKYGASIAVSDSIITQKKPRSTEVFDEDGAKYPSVDAAIRHLAEWLVQITAMPGRATP
jgi:hypothetical protein